MLFRGGSVLLLSLLASSGQYTSAFTPPKNDVRPIPQSLKVTGVQDPTSTEKYPVQISPTKEEVDKWLQIYGEASRKYRRDVFTAGDWVRTRRPDRFVNNLLTTFDSTTMRNIVPELSFITYAAIFICLYNDLFVGGWTDLSGVAHAKIETDLPALTIPYGSFSLPVSALGLLLTFRTNVSYQRWNQARTAWGKVINDSRSIMRMGGTWSKAYKDVDDLKIQKLGDAVCAFSRTLMNRLLTPQEDEANYRQYLDDMMTDKEYAERLKNAKHRPSASIAGITECVNELELNPIYQAEVELVITGLCDAMGACERIFTSPVPTFYTRHTARFLAVWLLSMPLALYEPFGSTWNHLGMIPVTMVIGAFLLGIEELATQMEEPFSILPMEKMSNGSIRTPVMEQVEVSKAAKPYSPEKRKYFETAGLNYSKNLKAATATLPPKPVEVAVVVEEPIVVVEEPVKEEAVIEEAAKEEPTKSPVMQKIKSVIKPTPKAVTKETPKAVAAGYTVAAAKQTTERRAVSAKPSTSSESKPAADEPKKSIVRKTVSLIRKAVRPKPSE